MMRVSSPPQSASIRDGHGLRGGLTDQDRKHPEVVEDHLEEGKLHLQAVLVLEGSVEDAHVRHCLGDIEGLGVDGNLAEGRREGRRRWNRHSGEGHAVSGAEEDDPAHRLPRLGEAGVGGGRHRSRVDVSRVGRDQGLGRATGRLRRSEIALDRRPQLVGRRRVEEARHRRLANTAHDRRVYPPGDGPSRGAEGGGPPSL